MMSRCYSTVLMLATTLVAAACAAPASGPRVAQPSDGPSALQASQPRGTLKIGWAREPGTLAPKFLSGGGAGEYTWLFNSALAIRDLSYTPRPMIASELPTREKGDWVVNPDGSMVTTYRLRENARWQDGAPIVARDFAFAYEVYTDDDMPVGVRAPESLMSRVEARDDRTVVIYWKELFSGANALGYRQLHPLPSHLLEEKYRTSRATFATGEEWTYAHVGSGPFRVDRWDPGARLVARANPYFFLGAPRIETIEIRFIADPNTVLANLLAGEIDLSSSTSITANEAVIAREQWAARGEGYIRTWSTRLIFVDFQHREVPNWQRAISDLRVRQALMHALDRDGIADVINLGLAPKAEAYIAPADPAFADVDRAISKYAYDPARAAALLGDAGWRRPREGAPLANAAGQGFDLEVWSDEEREATIVADYWKTAGVASNPLRVPNARRNDQEYRNHFPGTQIGSNTISQEDLHTVASKLPRAEIGWLGSNRGSFTDPEVERYHNLVLTSFSEQERRGAVVAMHRRLTELAAFGPLFYQVEVIAAKQRVAGPVGTVGAQTGITWNVWEWEVSE